MNARVLLYDGILKELRRLMVERMVKPEEVLITADEHGNVVRDVVKDTDLQQQYKTMRETLVYLSHLDHADTEMQMLDKLRMQLDGEEWQWDRLNTLCWVRCRLLSCLILPVFPDAALSCWFYTYQTIIQQHQHDPWACRRLARYQALWTNSRRINSW